MHCRNTARTRAPKVAAVHRCDYGSRRSRVARQLMLLVGAGVVVAVGAQSAAAAGWSTQPVQQPAHSDDAELNGVSCTSASDCIAVGQSVPTRTDEPIPLVEHWNGLTWSIQRTPLPPPGDWSGGLSGVSCTNSTACIAVGFGYSEVSGKLGPLAERWNGSSWSIERTPKLADGEQFDGVSCVSSTACTAVGGNGVQPIAERWDGHRWSPQNLHFDHHGEGPDALLGVSCTPGRCAAIGWDTVGLCGETGYDYSPLLLGSVPVVGFWTERRWSLQRQPDPGCVDSGGNVLNAVSCSSPEACTAVGTAVYQWDGHRWSIQPTRLGGDELTGVSCPSTNACTAIGSRIYTWSGHHWSSGPIPRPVDAVSRELAAVSCPARASCVAVGSYIDRGLNGYVLVESLGIGAGDGPTEPARQANSESRRGSC